METTFERVKRIVIEQLGVKESEAVPGASFVEDLGADSLDVVELIMAIEDEFSRDGQKIDISDEETEKIRTIQAAVDYLKTQGIKDN